MTVTLWKMALPDWKAPVTTEVMESRTGLLSSLLLNQSDTTKRRLLIFFPGNPGLVYFYTTLVEMLAANGFDVLVMGFVGHSLVDLNQGRYFVLQQQVEVATGFVKAVLAGAATAYAEGGCHVGGHSIGGWMAVQMAARFTELKKAFLLAPTICNMKLSPNGRKNQMFLKTWLISAFTSTVVPLAGSLPSSLFQWILRVGQRDDLDANGAWVAESMARKPMVQNLLMLAQSEFEQVTTLDVPMLQSIGPNRLVFYFVKKDGWVPLSDVELIRSAVGHSAVVALEDDERVPHAWCLKYNREVIDNGILPYV